jgi:phosphoglycolate phosphatase
MEARRRTVFFDLDGVLIDSRPAIERALNATLRARGYSALDSAAVDAYIGPPVLDAFRTILTERGADPAQAAACVTTFRSIYAQIGPRETPLMPGIAALLDRLDGRFALVVATSKARYLALAILDALGQLDRFAQIVGPAPEALDETKSITLGRAIALQPAADERLMIGDRKYDILAGREHRCRTIGVTWGSGTYAELAAAGADTIVATTAALFDAIVG